MKVLLLLLLTIVVTATALPVLKDDEAVKVIKKGLNEGKFLEIGDDVDIMLKENTTAGIAAIDETKVQPVVLSGTPEDVLLELVVISHSTAQASLHQSVIAPQAAVSSKPSCVVLPDSIAPEVIVLESMALTPSESAKVIDEEMTSELVEALPSPAAQNSEFYNDSGMSENAPEAGVFSTLQSWFNVFMNYFSSDGADDHQFNPSEKMW